MLTESIDDSIAQPQPHRSSDRLPSRYCRRLHRRVIFPFRRDKMTDWMLQRDESRVRRPLHHADLA